MVECRVGRLVVVDVQGAQSTSHQHPGDLIAHRLHRSTVLATLPKRRCTAPHLLGHQAGRGERAFNAHLSEVS